MTNSPKILLADDHDLVRETVAALLASATNATVTQASGLVEALALIGQSGPFDLVLLDFTMPGMTLPDGLEQAISANAPAPVAILSGTASPDIARRAMSVGARGFLPKTTAPGTLISAVHDMLDGKEHAPDDFLTSDIADRPAIQLTPREVDVLRGLCEGKSNKEIARDLDVQEVTVKLHVKTLSRKLNARNRTHAAMIARDFGLT